LQGGFGVERCTHTKRDGTRCNAFARPGKSCCTFHDPDHAAKFAAGRRRGGKSRSRQLAVLPADAADLPLRTVADVTTLLALTINQTRRGQLDAKISNAVGYLASVLLKAMETSEVEARLAALEAQQQALNGRRAAVTPPPVRLNANGGAGAVVVHR
jgi:hypothetical protein